MKKILLTALAFCITVNVHSQKALEFGSSCSDMKKKYNSILKNQNAASVQSYADTIHVAHYKIFIDTINYTGQSINAKTELDIVSKINNLSTFKLSLLQLIIDSVFINNMQVFFVYDDTTLTLPVIAPVNAGDTVHARVHYHGQPKKDASGWGGFYFSGTYAFNLGVGFAADPHNFGRAWYPCVDVFDDKSTYEFFINTPSTYKAFCNGELVNETTNPNGTKTWHWQMIHPIPSYLACLAVAPFFTLERDYNGIPVVWATMAIDTNSVLNTFQNINPIMDGYTNAYGPYPFDKIGYNLVPFNSGAMEHASAITLGKAFVNGTLTYETLWAHELAHMWWGDKVTCTTAEDMWLNEGWATYNEAFITQLIYGEAAYKNWIHTNHRKMVQFAHVPGNDGSYLPMNNIPHAYTYGMHVYQKGADMVHTLRNYMGDSLFFQGCQYYMSNRAYGNASSADLRDDLTVGSTINMNRFFDDWIFTPGWPHFSIDSVVYVPGGLDHYFVYTRQRSRGNNHIYEMPVQITFANEFSDTTVTVTIDSATNSYHIPLFAIYDFIAIDRYQKVSDATVDFERIITTTGTNLQMNETSTTMTVLNAGTDTSLVRVEHNYVTPDGFSQPNPGIRISDYHYWKTDGIFASNFLSKITFYYDGSTSTSSGYLDNSLITGTEDSVTILYRAGTWDEWQVVNGYTLSIFNPSDKRGQLIVDTLKKGEYVVGYYDYTVGTNELTQQAPEKYFTVAPNPSTDSFMFHVSTKELKNGVLKVFDTRGNIVYTEKTVTSGLSWNASNIYAGTYFASLFVNNIRVQTEKIILVK